MGLSASQSSRTEARGFTLVAPFLLFMQFFFALQKLGGAMAPPAPPKETPLDKMLLLFLFTSLYFSGKV